jgi:glycosyltransferase involved in cell wall biosynthesis
VNPEDLPVFFENAGYFILPSLYEAWGVVVHEAVLAGLPILTTNECGAATDFVVNGFNGFVYDATDEKKLKSIIQQIMTIPEDQYFEMSANSKLIASKINLNEWAATLNSVTK